MTSIRASASPVNIRILCSVLLAAGHAVAADNPTEVFEMPVVEVIGTTPLPGLGTALRDVPANVQVFNFRDVARRRATDVANFLDQSATSVAGNNAQGNAFQRDITFRGFAASPLLGTPQGISVFQDGVRINEAFGDVVNWDLLPPSAVSSIQLLPGSNPVFGLNALGGALSIFTKSGSQYPGTVLQAEGGSFGRAGAQFEHGGQRGHLDWFVTGRVLDDGGWAEHNASRVRQFFAKGGVQDELTDFDVALTIADNTLEGAQTIPLSWLDRPREPYTFPDRNGNKLAFLTAKGSRFLSESLLIGGNAYLRRYRNENFSSNVNDDFGFSDGGTGTPIFLNEGINDRSLTDQRTAGGGVQVTRINRWDGRSSHFVAGVSVDHGDTRFSQRAQAANFDRDRGAVGLYPFVDTVDVSAKNLYLSAYASEVFKPGESWALTASARWNHATIDIHDRLGDAPELDGHHVFARASPALGIAFSPDEKLTAFGAYNQGVRVPTPIELTCANANAPCKLPNLFLADPPLDPVVSRTVEAGARGKADKASWNVAAFRTELRDDIQFISSGNAFNAGYFRNVGRTRRQGLEVAGEAQWRAWRLAARYALVDATFRSAFVAHSPNNSTADAIGQVTVREGDRIPGIPRHQLKVHADWEPREGSRIGIALIAASSQYARGDENNRDVNGALPGYAIFNVEARWKVAGELAFFVQVANVFDRRYQNFAVLGANFFNGPNQSFGLIKDVPPAPEQFRGPGAPRAFVAGVEFRFR